jgi:hypothetical protein
MIGVWRCTKYKSGGSRRLEVDENWGCKIRYGDASGFVYGFSKIIFDEFYHFLEDHKNIALSREDQ